MPRLFDLAEWRRKPCHWSPCKKYYRLLGQMRISCRFKNPIFQSAWDNSNHISESLLSHPPLPPPYRLSTRKTLCPPCGQNGKWTTPTACTAVTGRVTCNRKRFILCVFFASSWRHHLLILAFVHSSSESFISACWLSMLHSATSCLYVEKWRVCQMWNPQYVSGMLHACIALRWCGVMSSCTLGFGWGGLRLEM